MQSLMGIEAYILDMIDDFIADPKPIKEFLDEKQVPEPVRDELRGILELVLLRREAGRDFVGTAFTKPLVLNHN